jgi:hypothetical protein
MHDFGRVGGKSEALFLVFFRNHLKHVVQFFKRLLACRHQSVATGNRWDFPHPGTILLAIKHDFVTIETDHEHQLGFIYNIDDTRGAAWHPALQMIEPYKSDGFCFFKFFDEGGDNFEQIADDAVVGDFEDRRILVLVDCGDCARTLHSHDVLDGAADPQREV